MRVYWEMEKHREFLQRGKSVANVCCNFVVTGHKCDLNTKLCMPHNASSANSALPDLQARLKLSALFRKYVYPIVKLEFGWLFEPAWEWVQEHELLLFSKFVTGATGGRLFWPRSHVDPDLWYTILVALDYGKGVKGGDFAFGGVGRVMGCRHGDVLIYNGLLLHGTTEFAVADDASGRVFFALYMKRAIVVSAARNQSLVGRVGSQPLHL